MANFAITLNDFLYICGIIATVWGAYKIIKEVKKPGNDLKETVKKHEEYLKKDRNEIEEIKEGNKVICKSIMTMINHELSGNDISNMRKMRDELQEYLIDK